MITTLNGKQLKDLLEFVAPDHETDPDQLETEVSIQFINEPGPDPETGATNQPGYYAWFSEYPEEGSIYLPETEQ